MQMFIGCLIGSLFCVALAADVKNSEENKDDKNSASKLKRDASLLGSVYHGPSYKYLPPSTISSGYDIYPGKVGSYGGYPGSHIPGLENVYRTGVSGHGHRHHGYPTTGHRNVAVYHSLDNEPTLNYGGGHHGYVVPSNTYNTGQGSTQFIRGGYKGITSSSSGAKLGPTDFSVNRPHTYVFANGNSIGSNTASGGGYHYTKGFGGSYAPIATGFQTTGGGFAPSTHGFGSQEDHHTDHVHNGAQEHVYLVSNIPTALENSYESKQTSVYQHSLPSVGVAAFNTKYYSQKTDQPAPAYASGHKGLGHFGFTANKPQAVHASLSGAGFQQPSYSKPPFKPSIFLGAKFEGTASDDGHVQKYMPLLEEATGSSGYEYPLPTETYQEPNHQQTVELQTTSLHDTDSAYLPSKNEPDSVYELSAGSNGNYLTPTDSYGNPYSH